MGPPNAETALRLPYRAVLSARQMAVLAVAFPALVHLVVTTRLVLAHERGFGMLAVAIAMLLVRYGSAVVSFAHRRRWGLVWLVMGVLLSGEIELLAWAYGLGITGDGFTSGATAMFFAGPCMQAAYAFVFGWIEMRFIAEASDESADQAAVAAAVWLFGLPLARSIVFSRASVLAHDMLSVHLMTTIPLALALVAITRLVLRRWWLEFVCAGKSPHWRIVPWDDTVPPGLPRVAVMRAGTPPRILATLRAADAPSPYRTAESFEPRAAFPAPPSSL